MRIDTNERRKYAGDMSNAIGTKIRAFLREDADELDRLYAIEDGTKPMTREEIEEWLKENGWEKSRFVYIWEHQKHTGKLSLTDGFYKFSYNTIHPELVTRNLLSALLK